MCVCYENALDIKPKKIISNLNTSIYKVKNDDVMVA